MRINSYILSLATGLSLSLSACNNDGGSRSHAPIVLGDSSTIVTEADERYLQDHVTDIKAPEPRESDTPAPPPAHDTIRPASTAPTSVAAEQKETTKPQEPAPAPVAANGLNVAFSDVTVSFPGINAKSAQRNQNLGRANSATYQLTSGNLNGAHLVATKGTVTKVSQRYQTMLMLKDEDGSLPLENMSNTTDWEALSGRSGNYTITGLNANKLEGADFTPAQLKRAITLAARRHRIKHKDEEEWIATVRNIRTAPHKPLIVVLRSVMWKIDGKGANGRSFSKQIRIDVPVN